MTHASGRLIIAGGLTLVLVGVLAFGLMAPATTFGQTTDVSPTSDGPTDVGSGTGADGSGATSDGSAADGSGAALPPASLPDAGSGGYADIAGSPRNVAVAVLAGLGVALASAGLAVGRLGRARSLR